MDTIAIKQKKRWFTEVYQIYWVTETWITWIDMKAAAFSPWGFP